jgi:hypothetical protein
MSRPIGSVPSGNCSEPPSYQNGGRKNASVWISIGDCAVT